MKNLPAKQRANIGASFLEYIVGGAGPPSIVLINGGGGPIEGWLEVFGDLASIGRVFAYNRAGIGGSSKPTEPQTGDAVNATLRALLAQIRLPPPYILVGHSLGGLYANLFARDNPDDVAGVVLLEATAPDDVAMMAAGAGPLQKFTQRALDALFGKDPLGEMAQSPRAAQQVNEAGPFPNVPLVVVTGGKPALAWLMPAKLRQGRADNQRALSTVSRQGRQIIARKSGHFPQFSQPDVVVQAVREVVSFSREAQKLRQP